MLLLAGCAKRAGDAGRIAADMGALPPDTVMLSQMMRELSAEPGFTEKLLQQMDQGERSGALLTPQLFDLFRKLVLGKDWTGLDRFPGWTIHRVTRTVGIGESLLQVQEGAHDADLLQARMGPYALDRAETVSLDAPSDRPGFSSEGLVTPLGEGVERGDGADPQLAPMHAESARLAEVLNRLSLNGSSRDGRQTAPFAVTLGGHSAGTPQELIAALAATGHSVTVADARFFANFGHLHYKGKNVEMPFWLDTGLRVPGQHWWQASRPYLIPVSHAEYEWMVTGPRINADVVFYFGIDGRAEFRTNDQRNQSWVMKRYAHQYRGADAMEVTRLTGLMLRAYASLHAAHPQLPFGGYYTLGVCQDVVAAIEQRMTGAITIYPTTARTELFRDQPDAEVLRLMEAIPKDTAGTPPVPERVFGSLPTTDFATLTVPGLREDTERTFAAWQSGRLHAHRTGRILSWIGIALASLLVLALMRSRSRRTGR